MRFTFMRPRSTRTPLPSGSPRPLRYSLSLWESESSAHFFQRAARPAFTLTELLMVMLILALLVGVALSAFSGAAEQARVARTRAIISKLDQLIMEKWDGYRTRAVPIKNTTNVDPITMARNRLYALRELMRLEMPCNIKDLCTAAELTSLTTNQELTTLDFTSAACARSQYLPAMPAVARSYKRKVSQLIAAQPIAANKKWTDNYQGAECLYLIISGLRDGDKSALDYFTADEIGNFDNDAVPEILDAWGTPIEFFRWAPGYIVQNEALTMQTNDADQSPDPFDPLKVDVRPDPTKRTFALYPLIVSWGPDKQIDLQGDNIDYYSANPTSDPYFANSPATATPIDLASDGPGHGDNITNHFVENL